MPTSTSLHRLSGRGAGRGYCWDRGEYDPIVCLSSSAGEQIGQSEHCQAYTWEPEREHKGLVTVAWCEICCQ